MSNYLCRLRRSPNIVKELAGNQLNPKRQKVVIDFSSPNIAKPFHIGNMRSTLIGMFIQRLHRSLDHEIISINHLGDWGTQFAHLVCGWPKARPIASQWDSLPDVERIRMLTDCYIASNVRAKDNPQYLDEVRKLFSKMEEDLTRNIPSAELELWREIRGISLNYLDTFYNRFNVRIDRCIGESEYVKETNRLVDKLISQKIVYKNRDGLYIMDEDGSGKYAIIRKSDGSTVYLSREIACILHRDELFNADSYVYVVDRAQQRHFDQLRQILDRIGRGDLAQKINHVSYGRVVGLSTRKGRTEAVEEIASKGRKLALDYVSRSPTIRITDPKECVAVAENLAVSTVIVSDLKRARKSEYRFSFDNAFAENQNNAVLLQERHSRLHSIEVRNSHLLSVLNETTVDFEIENIPEAKRLLKQLCEFEAVLISAFEHNEPAHLTVYLMRLANISGSAASALQVRDQPEKLALGRLLLLSATRHVLAEGLQLLGIDPLEKM